MQKKKRHLVVDVIAVLMFALVVTVQLHRVAASTELNEDMHGALSSSEHTDNVVDEIGNASTSEEEVDNVSSSESATSVRASAEEDVIRVQATIASSSSESLEIARSEAEEVVAREVETDSVVTDASSSESLEIARSEAQEEATDSSLASSESLSDAAASENAAEEAVVFTADVLESGTQLYPANLFPQFSLPKSLQSLDMHTLHDAIEVRSVAPNGSVVTMQHVLYQLDSVMRLVLIPPAVVPVGTYDLTLTLSEGRGVVSSFLHVFGMGEKAVLFSGPRRIGERVWNTDRDRYVAGETATMSMGLVDTKPCTAQMLETTFLGGLIDARLMDGVRLGTCRDDAAVVPLGEQGEYGLHVRDETDAEERRLVVESSPPMVRVQRAAASRVEPRATTTMYLTVVPTATFIGVVTDTVPFMPIPNDTTATMQRSGDVYNISWEKRFEAGVPVELSYSFTVPSEVTNTALLLGPATVKGEIEGWTEPVILDEESSSSSESSTSSESSESSHPLIFSSSASSESSESSVPTLPTLPTVPPLPPEESLLQSFLRLPSRMIGRILEGHAVASADINITEERQWQMLILERPKISVADGTLTTSLELTPTKKLFEVNESPTFKLLSTEFDTADTLTPDGHLKNDVAMTKLLEATLREEDVTSIVLSELVQEHAEKIALDLTENTDTYNTLKESADGRRAAVQQAATNALDDRQDVQDGVASIIQQDTEIRALTEQALTREVRSAVIQSLVSTKKGTTVADAIDTALNTAGITDAGTMIADAVKDHSTATTVIADGMEETAKNTPSNVRTDTKPTLTVTLTDKNGRTFSPKYHFKKGSVLLALEPERTFTPGLYTLDIVITNPVTGEEQHFTQDFAWGVLAMNPNQDVYNAGDKARIDIGVLDDHGEIVCSADLSLIITAPNGEKTVLQTDDQSITVTGTCAKKEAGFIDPDFTTLFSLDEAGTYQLTLKAITENGEREISSDILVLAAGDTTRPFTISRTSATRLWPFAPAPMTVTVDFHEPFTGSITDIVPEGFLITDAGGATLGTINDEQGAGTTLTWKGSWSAGDTQTYTYIYDAPDISPEFYLVGPLVLSPFDTAQGANFFVEQRSWQIANDGDGTANIRTWDNGGGDGLWSTAANWTSDTVPDSDDIAYFGTTSTANATVNSSFAGMVGALKVAPGYTGTITIRRNLTLSGGSLTLSGGTLDFSTAGKTLTVSQDFVTYPKARLVAGTGTIILTGTGTNRVLTSTGSFNNLTLNNGLVGYWKFDEGTGSTIAKDSSGNGNNGTLTNGPTWSTSVPTTQFYNPKSLHFDGVNDYVNAGNKSILDPGGTPNLGVSAWVKRQLTTSNMVVVNRRSIGGYTVSIQSNNLINITKYGVVAIYICSFPTDTSWHHLGISWNSTGQVGYIDGAVCGTDSNTNNFSASTAGLTYFGGDPEYANGYAHGFLDDVRIYNRALSASEVARLAAGHPDTGSGVYTLGSNLDVNGNLNIISGTLSGSTANITVAGNWTNQAGFTKGTSTVTFDGTGNQTISGSTIFNTLAATTSTARTLFTDYTSRQSVSGALTLRGISGNKLSLRSTRSGSASAILLDGDSGTQTIDYLDVKDSNATGGASPACYLASEGCTNTGNNTNWAFYPTYTIAGTVYTDEGSTGIGAGRDVSVSLNGATRIASGTTVAGGYYVASFTNVTLTGGTIMSIYLDNETEKAVTVTLGSGSNMTGMHLYQDHLIVRSDSGSVAIGNSHLAVADNNGDSDIKALYNVDTSSTLQVAADKELWVWTGDTFTPGGRVKSHDVEVKGTLTLGTNGLTVTGSLVANAGTMTTSTGIVLGSTATTETLSLGTNATQNLTLNSGLIGYWKFDEGTGSTIAKDSSGNGNNGTLTNGPTWSTAAPSTRFYNPKSLHFDGTDDYVTMGDISQADGLSAATICTWIRPISLGNIRQIVMKSDLSTGWFIESGGSGLGTSSDIVFVPSGAGYGYSTSNPLTTNTWGHVCMVFDGSLSGTARLKGYFNGSALTLTYSGTPPSSLVATAHSLIVGARPAGTFGTDGNLDDVRIYNRSLSASEVARLAAGHPDTGSGVYTLGSNLDVNGNLNIISGTLSGSTANITVAGNWSNVAGFTKGTSTVTFDGSGNQTISGSTIFHNFTKTVSAASTFFTDYTGRQSVSGALTLRGAASNLLSLRSTRSGSASSILLDGDSGTQNLLYLNVKDSNASGGAALNARNKNITDSGNNTNWTFSPTITGRAFSDEGTTALASKIVAGSANGGATFGTGTTSTNGTFTLTYSGATMTGGTILTLWLDGGSEKAVTVTLGSGSSMTGMDLYQNHLIVRSDSGSVAMTNARLNIADNNGDSDIKAIYSVDTSSTLQVAADKELWVWTGDVFTPGARVKSHDVEVKGTLTLGTNGLTVTGSLVANAGTMTTSTGIVLGSTATSEVFTPGNSVAFNNLTINNGLVGYWKFDEGTGSTIAKDSSGNGNNGTLTNGPTWSTNVPTTRFYNPKSLHFDGTNDYVNATISAVSTTASWMAWVKTSSANSNMYVMDMGTNAGSISMNNGKLSALPTGSTAGGYLDQIGSDLRDGQWKYIAITQNGAVLTGYVNGIQIAQISSAATASVSNPKIGRYGPGPHYFLGLIDDVRIYNRALSASEVAQLAAGHQDTGSGVYTLGSNLDVNGNLSIIAGGISAGSQNITLAGNYTSYGTFTKGTSTVTLDGSASQTMSGNTVFHNLTLSTTSARTLFMDYTGQQSASGALTLKGVLSNQLSIRSTRSGSGARITLGAAASQNVKYANVKDSNAGAGSTIQCLIGCTDTDNNTNYTFATTRTWDGGGGNNNCSTAANWQGDTVPTSNEGVVFDGTSTKNVTWDASCPSTVASFTMDAGYTGTGTLAGKITVTGNMTLGSGALVTAQGASGSIVIGGNLTMNRSTIKVRYSTTSGGGSGQLIVVGGNMTIGTGSIVTADGQGFTSGNGPGSEAGDGKAGAHGGLGGGGYGDTNPSGITYGSFKAPSNLGSGESSYGATAGYGGGAIIVRVSGASSLFGTITANGLAPINAGAGGSVFLTTGTITGSGTIQANGGSANISGRAHGGGGRIAVILTSGTSFSSYRGTMSAHGGTGAGYAGGAGTIYQQTASQSSSQGTLIIDNANLSTAIGVDTAIPANTTWQIGHLLLKNKGTLHMPSTTTLILSNDDVQSTGATGTGNLRLNGGTLTLGSGSLTMNTLTNLVVDTGSTLTGNLTIKHGAKMRHSANTSSERYKMILSVIGNLTVENGGRIDVDGVGYSSGNGPGAGAGNGGAGAHGGFGGGEYFSAYPSGATYGSITSPTRFGSAEATYGANGGNGGGAIVLTVSGLSTLNGLLTANGVAPAANAGAGGSVFLTTGTISGTGTIQANGGSANIDGRAHGGGGRVAVVLTAGTSFSGFSGTMNAHGGTGAGYVGGAGTIYKKTTSQSYGDLIIDNNSLSTSTSVVTHLNSSTSTGVTVGSLTVQNAGKFTIGGDDRLTIAGTGTSLTVNSGTTFTNGGTLNFGGRAGAVAGTFTQSGAVSTVNYIGQNDDLSVTLLSTNYKNIGFNNPGTTFNVGSNISTLGAGGSLSLTGGTLTVTNGQVIALSGAWINAGGTFRAGTGTVILRRGPAVTQQFKETSPFYNLTFSGSSTYRLGSLLTVSGALTISNGTLDVSTSNYGINLKGNWNKQSGGTFTKRSGTVTLSGTGSQTMSGTTNFHNLTATTGGRTIFFSHSGRQSASGTLTLHGTSAVSRMKLRSTRSGSGAGLVLTTGGTQSLQYLDVQDSNATGGATLVCSTGCVNSLRNTNWAFPWSGTVYTDKGSTVIGAGKTVAVSINGGAAVTADTDAGGAYIITNAPSAGDTVAIYLDGETEKAALVTISDGIVLGTMDLYQNTLIVRNEYGSVTKTSTLSGATAIADTDLTNFFTISNGGLVMTLGRELLVWTGSTFHPGGTLAADDLDVRGRLSMGGKSLNVSGSVTKSVASGSVVTSTGTTTFDSATRETVALSGATLSTVQFTGGGVYEMSGALKMSTALTISAGTLSTRGYKLDTTGATYRNDGTLKLKGSETLTGFTNDSTSGTTLFSSSGSYTGLLGITSFKNLSFSGAGTWTLASAITTNGNLSITGATLDVSGSNYGVTVRGSWKAGSGTFTKRAGSVSLTGSGAVNAVQPFHTLTMSGGGTYTLQRSLSTSGALTLTNGALAMSSKSITASGVLLTGGSLTGGTGTLTVQNNMTLSGGTLIAPTTTRVAGNWLKRSAATFTASGRTVTFNGTNQTLSGSTTFYNLTKSGGSGYTLTFARGTTQTIAGTWTAIGQNGGNLRLISSQSGGQWYIDPQSTRTLQYLRVTDSNNTNASAILCSNDCVNGGNNTNWAFPITVTVYTDSGTTLAGSGMTVAIAVNGSGATKATATTNAQGVATFTSTSVVSGDIVTTWIDGETTDGVSITKTNGTTLGFTVYGDTVQVSHETGLKITSSDVGTGTLVNDSDVSDLLTYAYSAGSGHYLSMTGSSIFRIKTGSTFQATGNASVYDIDINGTLQMGSRNILVRGSWDATDGSVTGTNNVTFETETPNQTITSDGNSFYDVTFKVPASGSISDWFITDALTVTNSQTIALAGTSDQISDVAVTATTTTANITWNTTETTTTVLRYGTAADALTSQVTNASLLQAHDEDLSGLSINTTYYFQIIARNASAVTTTGSVLTFNTLGSSITQAQLDAANAAAAATTTTSSSGGGGGGGRNPCRNSALLKMADILATPNPDGTVTVTWITNADAVGAVVYGKTSGDEQGVLDTSEFKTDHAITLKKLINGPYTYHTESIDKCGQIIRSASQEFVVTSSLETDTTGLHGAATPEEASSMLESITQRFVDLTKDLAGKVSVPALKDALSLQQKSLAELAKLVPGPILSAQPRVETTPTTATISWTTNEPSNSLVSYAAQALYSDNTYAQTSGNPDEQSQEHTVSLNGLTPGTLYHYAVKSQTAIGTETQSQDFTFKTAQTGVEIQSYSIEILSTESAAFRWKTNADTTTVLTYAPYVQGSVDKGRAQTQTVTALSSSHQITVKDFEPGTIYEVELAGSDSAGNAVTKTIARFSTESQNLAPIITQVQTDTALSPGKDSKIQAVISWTTNEHATGQVFYQEGVITGSGDVLAKSTNLDGTLNKKHIVLLPSLAPGTIYSFQVESKDATGLTTRSQTFTVLTPRQEESIFQVILQQMEDTFGWMRLLRGQ